MENIPKDKPIIFVGNHPSSFIEPSMMACFLPVELHFLVRGDMFNKKWLKWLMVATHQIPIFRKQDGLENLKQNLPTQEIMGKLFDDKKALLMFPEASTAEHMYIRMIKKGVGRFAFLNPNKGLVIIPLGITYPYGTPFNSEISINIGKAIEVDEIIKMEFQVEYERLVYLMNLIKTGMKNTVRDISNYDREKLIYHVTNLHNIRTQSSLVPIVDEDATTFKEQVSIAQTIDTNDGAMEEAKELVRKYPIPIGKKPGIVRLALMIILLPIHVIAMLVHFIPQGIASYVGYKKVKGHEFQRSVYLAVFVILYILIGFLSVFVSLFLGWKILLFFTIFILLGVFESYYQKAFQLNWTYMFSDAEAKMRSRKIEDEDFSFLIKER